MPYGAVSSWMIRTQKSARRKMRGEEHVSYGPIIHHDAPVVLKKKYSTVVYGTAWAVEFGRSDHQPRQLLFVSLPLRTSSLITMLSGLEKELYNGRTKTKHTKQNEF
jgi:hypothetical protein